MNSKPEPHVRVVENLQRLYSVVISLAIAEALRRAYGDFMGKDLSEIFLNLKTINILSLLVTIIPFYHGANRYIEATYLTGEREAKPVALLFDFLFLFFEGVGFFFLALFIDNLKYFCGCLIVVLLFDFVWSISTKFTEVNKNKTKFKMSFIWHWGALNVVFSVILGFVILYIGASSIWPFLIILIRSILDYRLSWNFYFGKK